MPKKDGSMTVAEKRAAGTNKAAQNKAAKDSGGVRPGSVADNRAKAKEKAQTMQQYKTENNINKTETRKKEERQLPARQEREGSVAHNRANNNQPANTGNSNQSAGAGAGAGTPAPTAEETAMKQMQNNYKYTKEDSTYNGMLKTRIKGGQSDPLMRVVDGSDGYQSFHQRTHDEDGNFSTDKFFAAAGRGWENDGLSKTEKMSADGLYQDRYNGDAMGHSWTKWAGGAQHGDDEGGVFGSANARGDNFYESASRYMSDGGYAGDVLKHIDGIEGEKDRLTTPDQISWYNSVVKRAQDHDWGSTYGEGKGKSHDPRGLKYGGKVYEQRTTGGGHTSMESYTPTTYDGDGNAVTTASNSHDPSTYKTYDPADTLPGEPGKPHHLPQNSLAGSKRRRHLINEDKELAKKYPGYKPGHMTADEHWVSGYMPGNAKASGSSGGMTAEQMKKATYREEPLGSNSGPAEYGNSSGQSNTNGYNKEYAGFDYKTQQQQPYTNPFSKSTKANKALNIDFSFNPNKFNQGQ